MKKKKIASKFTNIDQDLAKTLSAPLCKELAQRLADMAVDITCGVDKPMPLPKKPKRGRKR